ncbi:MAG: DUF2911 domain-containing protein [Candidatus Binatia bacterium]
MQPSYTATMLALTLTLAPAAHAAIELPRPSPAASVSQRIGLTDVRVEYNSPGVKDRKIWGDLVPYGELWRTGANSATRITFSRDVKVGGADVKAGTYTLLTIPREGGKWTLVLNSDTALNGTRGYDQKKDVARAEVATASTPKRERMTFLFADTDDDSTELRLEWDKLAVRIPIEVPTGTQAMESVKGTAGDLSSAARYLLDENKEPERALMLAESAVRIDPSWSNTYVLARTQAANNQFADAVETAKKSHELGLKAEYFFWKEDVEKSIEEWSAKAK